MNIFITGAAGFIGFHLSLALKDKGHFIIGYDNFNPFYDVTLKRSREKILNNQGIKVIEGDIQDKELLKKIIITNHISLIFHLAAQAGVRYSTSHPEYYIASNLAGFTTLLEVCKEFPSIQFIFTSSSSVYGLNQKIPFEEKDTTDTPANLYGATKKADEILAYSYHHLYNIPIVALRYFTVYGPWGRPDMAYFHFTHSILNNIPIKLFNYGNMNRDFTYIDDIVKGTIAATGVKGGFEIFNLGNNHPIKISKLVQLLEENLGKGAIVKMVPEQKGEILTTYADISKSQKILGYNPSVSLEEGIPLFIEWYKKYHQI